MTLISFWNTGVKMFFVSGQGSVTTLSQPQTLYAYQFVNYEPGNAGLEKKLEFQFAIGSSSCQILPGLYKCNYYNLVG